MLFRGATHTGQWPQYLREYAESQMLQAGAGHRCGRLSFATPLAPPATAAAGHLHEAGHPAGQDAAKGAQAKGRHKVTSEIMAKTNPDLIPNNLIAASLTRMLHVVLKNYYFNKKHHLIIVKNANNF